jgi:hypothetical protein
MTEVRGKYIVQGQPSPWMCNNCGQVLAEVVGQVVEFQDQAVVRLLPGQGVEVLCRWCGHTQAWDSKKPSG